MGKKAHSGEEIIHKLRQAEVLFHGDKSVAYLLVTAGGALTTFIAIWLNIP